MWLLTIEVLKVVLETRNEFEIYQSNALKFLQLQECNGKRKKKLNYVLINNEIHWLVRDHFTINNFNVILDIPNSELRKRRISYENIEKKFSVSTEVDHLYKRQFREKSKRLTNAYVS